MEFLITLICLFILAWLWTQLIVKLSFKYKLINKFETFLVLVPPTVLAVLLVLYFFA